MSKVKFGISEVHVATFTTNEDGTPTYDIPVKVPGAVSLSVEAQGDESKFYADNGVYYSKIANAGYEATLTIAKLTEYIKTNLLGQKKDANGALIESTDDKQSPFVLMFQVEGDETNTRYVYYNCTLSRPSSENTSTEDSVEVATDELTLSISQRYDKAVKAEIEEDNSKYNTVFTTVYEPEQVVTP
ncbi:phage tail protein [Erysipelotrichaceae bacterium OttesenSCG-928-M19]|nr:phage tail protein [Erysipelotrichaceae bacterium OttesenSCG-928-M19]